ncbi:MFS transporter [Legionella israelensis]|uniref:Lysosomal dipeptide transporter MFSD1 n=2 Tax=Legionella israelensis TaxID=454 RepID=A0AAX1EEK0_9GAMM|nr:MFS transporter [Legionella israelensis]
MNRKFNRYSSLLPYISFMIAMLFYLTQYFLRMSITGIENFLTKTFHINAVTLSLVAASFYYAYALVQIPAGFIIDRLSPRIVITTASFIVTFGAVICWHANTPSDLFIARIFMGLGGAFAFLSLLKMTNVYFRKELFPFLNGLIFAIGTAASILAGAPLRSLLQNISWKSLIFDLSIISFTISLLALFFLRPHPQKTSVETRAENKVIPYSYKHVVANLNLWFTALFAGFSFTFITVFAGLWIIPILETAHPQVGNISSYGSSLLFLGFGIGALSLGGLTKFININQLMLSSSMAMLILFSFFIALPALNIYIQFIILFLLGLSVSSTTLSFSYTALIVSPKVCGVAFSIINICQILIGALMLPLSGYLVSFVAQYHNISSQQALDSVDYQIAMSILMISALICIICSWKLKPVR